MIEVQRLTKQFKDTLAVDDLTFSVTPGLVTGFLGPNGAGKSTTMRVIVGLDRPTSGEALVDGKSYRTLDAPLRSVGAMLDAGQVHPRRTASAHLLSLAATIGAGQGRVREVLELVGLPDQARRRVGTFSLGMRQRLGIAAALLGDPSTIILDEPMNGLDPDGIIWVRSLLRHLAREGRTVLVSSHLMGEMAQTADHLIVVGRGRLVADVATHDLLQGPSSALRVRTPDPLRLTDAVTGAGGTTDAGDEGALLIHGLTAGDLARLALAHRIEIHELVEQDRSLEEAFLELTNHTTDFRAQTSPERTVLS
ncbi:ATP-binding cassette domain-containing protein [Nocardioides bigeumensis]|uniref:ABC transporter ATP-binding protein n=1 Tax=Nocardioides bigeumensis TaxID=433657 RepID=A0ABP5JFA6_9ACTN